MRKSSWDWAHLIMKSNDGIKQGRRGSKQYYHEGHSYRVRVGKIQLPGHCDNLVANDVFNL